MQPDDDDNDDDLPGQTETIEEFIENARGHFARMRAKAHRDLDDWLDRRQEAQELSFQLMNRDVQGLPRQ